MSQSHKPLLSSAVLFAILWVNSLATPVANPAPRVSIIAAYEPVHIIPTDHLIDPQFQAGRPITSDDGTTVTTNFEIPRSLIHRRKPQEITSVSEPVNIIPSDELQPEPAHLNSHSTTTDDGTTLVTDYDIPRSVVRRRAPRVPVDASEPVNIIPANELPPGHYRGDGISNTTNDGNTVTTTFNTHPGNHSGKDTRPSRSALTLVQPQSVNNQSLAAISSSSSSSVAELGMGINCEGSKIMCIGASQTNVMHSLRDYMYAIPAGYRYYTGQDIACMKHTVYPNPWVTWGFYCAFMQGNIPPEGVDGTVIQLKMQQMIEHHCLGCGSVPFSDDNDPRILGILTVNYVRQSECEGLCYYKPPGGTPEDAVEVPKGMVLAS